MRYSLKCIEFISIFVVLSFFVMPAMAFQKDTFAQRFTQSFGHAVTVSHGETTQKGDDVTIENVVITGSPLSPATSLGRVSFFGITEKEHGGFFIKKVSIPALRYTYQGSSIHVNDAILTNVDLPPNKGLYDQGVGFRYLSGQFRTLELFDYRKNRLGMLEDGKINLQYSIRQNPVGFEIVVSKIKVFVENFPDGSTRDDFISMGYKTATGTLTIKGAYGGNQSLMDLESFHLTIDQGGSLIVALKMDGITVKSLLTVMTLQRENDQGKLKTSQMWLGILSEVQRYNFYNAALRFDDLSLTNKIIKAEAKRANSTPDKLRDKWKEKLPGWLSFIKNTNLMEEAQSAIAKYLDNPKSLEIYSYPMVRLPIIMLAISGKVSPNQFVRELNISMNANH